MTHRGGVSLLVSSFRRRTQRFLTGPFSPGVEISAQVLVVSNDGRLLFSGGHWDCSLRVTQLGKGKLVGRICRHIGTVLPLVYDLDIFCVLDLTFLSAPFSAPLRCCYLLGSGSVRYLPHLWFKGHLLYRVAGSAAGELLASISPSRLFSCAQHTAELTPFSVFRGASPAACLHGRCRFSVDMTRRSPVWPSAQNWTWLSPGQRSEMAL